VGNLSVYKTVKQDNEEIILHQYAYLVKKIAHHLSMRLPSNIQIDDLIQSGMLGLLEAAKNYSDEKGASFETYAAIRIRGNMLDEVRRENWLPRSVYSTAKKISATINQLEKELGRDARDIEISKALEVSIEQYHQMLFETNSIKFFNLDEIMNEDAHADHLTTSIQDPLENIQIDRFRKDMIEAIKQLPEKEQIVLSLYYEKELNLKEIGLSLGVSESRICQIHSQAMLRLKSRISSEKQSNG